MQMLNQVIADKWSKSEFIGILTKAVETLRGHKKVGKRQNLTLYF